MSRDTILKDEDDVKYSYDNMRTQGWLDGHVSGLEAAVAWLRERAIELFRKGSDEEATRLRKLSEEMLKELGPRMEASAKRHEKDHPIVITDEDDD